MFADFEPRFGALQFEGWKFARCLLVVDPEMAESMVASPLAVDANQASPRADRETRVFRTTSGFVQISDAGGRFWRELPPDIPPNQVVDLPAESDPTPLQGALAEIIDRMAGTGSDERLAVLQGALDACAPGHSGKILDGIIAKSLEITSLTIESPARGFEAQREFLEQLTTISVELRTGLQSGAALAATLLCISNFGCAAPTAEVHNEIQAQVAAAAAVGFLTGATGLPPVTVAQGLAARFVRTSGEAFVRGAAEEYHGIARSLMRGALDTGRLDEFYEVLFDAAVFVVAALLIAGGARGELARQGYSEEQLKPWTKLIDNCDERMVRIAQSFQNAVVHYSSVNALETHRRQVRKTMEEEGEQVGTDLARDYIENMYFYPRKLLGSLVGADPVDFDWTIE